MDKWRLYVVEQLMSKSTCVSWFTFISSLLMSKSTCVSWFTFISSLLMSKSACVRWFTFISSLLMSKSTCVSWFTFISSLKFCCSYYRVQISYFLDEGTSWKCPTTEKVQKMKNKICLKFYAPIDNTWKVIKLETLMPWSSKVHVHAVHQYI